MFIKSFIAYYVHNFKCIRQKVQRRLKPELEFTLQLAFKIHKQIINLKLLDIHIM